MLKDLRAVQKIIISDPQIIAYASKFHSKNWLNLSLEEKKGIFSFFNKRVAELLGYKELHLIFSKGKDYGVQSAFNWSISMNQDVLERDCGWESLDTYFHEWEHSFQHRIVEGRVSEIEKKSATKEEKMRWRDNFLPGNYFDSDGEREFYKFQWVERDAWSTGMLMARQFYFNARKELGNDETWEEYCNDHIDVIKNMISINDETIKLAQSYDDDIRKIYSKRESLLPYYEAGKRLFKELKNRDFTTLSYEETIGLLSPFAFENLNLNRKVSILNHYLSFVGVDSNVHPVEAVTLGAFRFNGQSHSTLSAMGIINSVLTYRFKIKVQDAIKNGSDDELDEVAIKELKMNLYRNASGKKINYISDYTNLFKFSLQPYAKYEALFFLREFKRMEEAEKKVYGISHEDTWRHWNDFYSNDLIFKTMEEVSGIPFEEYYSKQLEEYATRINEDRKQRELAKKRKSKK